MGILYVTPHVTPQVRPYINDAHFVSQAFVLQDFYQIEHLILYNYSNLYSQIRPIIASQIHSNPNRRSLTAELKNDTIENTLLILGSLTSKFQLAEFQLKGEL